MMKQMDQGIGKRGGGAASGRGAEDDGFQSVGDRAGTVKRGGGRGGPGGFFRGGPARFGGGRRGDFGGPGRGGGFRGGWFRGRGRGRGGGGWGRGGFRGGGGGRFGGQYRPEPGGVFVRPEWELLKEIPFSDLAGRGATEDDVPSAEDVETVNALHIYRSALDDITPKEDTPLKKSNARRALQPLTTSDDELLMRVCAHDMFVVLVWTGCDDRSHMMAVSIPSSVVVRR